MILVYYNQTTVICTTEKQKLKPWSIHKSQSRRRGKRVSLVPHGFQLRVKVKQKATRKPPLVQTRVMTDVVHKHITRPPPNKNKKNIVVSDRPTEHRSYYTIDNQLGIPFK